ncbi:YeeE/YedE family protein [Clostridium fermenticellae]|uniref:YeeE/YedE family protein n=1 Tax=Clostridium fermenticellae TaxID=2068654 RepID=A0A386H6V0_9CLOT|nr:YeeE/YedE family protein [Clostridium fermenticellae]
MNKTQIFVGVAILIAMAILAASQSTKNPKLGLFLITGLAIGYLMQRSRFGFAGGIKKIYLTGEASLTKALMFLFAISLVVAAAVHYGAFLNGGQVAYRAAAGAKIIPGTQNVDPVCILAVIGGFLFGIGMMLGGGCASGTLTDAGEGEGRALIVLFFFVTGSLWGGHDMTLWQKTPLYTWNKRIYLPDVFGYMGAIIISLLGFLAIYVFAKWYENKRKRENTFIPLEYEEWEKEVPESEEYKFFSKETYHKFFVKRWSFYTGAVLLAAMFEVILISTGKSWGVTTTFMDWGAWLYQAFGLVDVSKWPYFAKEMKTIHGGFMNDPASMRNLGIIIGALIAPLLAGHFSFKTNFKFKDIIFYAIGGILMGYGARLATGCNIGALYSGICNFSLSGWTFMIALVIGGIMGVKLVKKFNIAT